MSTTLQISEAGLRARLRAMITNEGPVNVNNVVDKSAELTDPTASGFVPQSKEELEVSLKSMVSDLPRERVKDVHAAIKAAAQAPEGEDAKESTMTTEDEMKDEEKGGDVEESIRAEIRKMIVEIAPSFASGASYSGPMTSDESPESNETGPERKRHSTMVDVGGDEFSAIAQELGFSHAGAKRAVDTAFRKAQWLGDKVMKSPEELEVLVLTSMDEYIQMLVDTGELTQEEEELMYQNPDIVRDLDGFREHMHDKITSARKAELPPGEFRP